MQKDFIFLFWLLLPLLVLGACIPQFSDKKISWKSSDIHLSTFSKLLSSSKASSANVLFLGTSRTMNGIHCPELNRLSDQIHVNLGINWFGHGLRLNQLESWLQTNQPQLIVLEVPLLFRFNDHPHLAHTLHSITLRNLWHKNPLRALKNQLAQTSRWCVQNLIEDENPDLSRIYMDGYFRINTPRGLGNSDSAWAEKELTRQNRISLPYPSLPKQIYYTSMYQHQWAFIQSMAHRCNQENIEFRLLALPKCGFYDGDPWLKEVQSSLAERWSPPSQLLQKSDLWRDLGHLNEKGAIKLAYWLSEKVEDALESRRK
jgi:hypothetical protein